ncbi:MAG TPA: hypothetical protein VKU38_04350 [Ktedonobacteraceae bacterium]|nr:hypothetical protein [Ktedonobacteraceae bacterium]
MSEEIDKPIFDVAVTHFREIGINPKAALPDYYDVDSLVFVKVFKMAVKKIQEVLRERQRQGEQVDDLSFLDARIAISATSTRTSVRN